MVIRREATYHRSLPRQRRLINNKANYMNVISEPPNAPIITIIQGGSFQRTSILNKMAAKAKSMGAMIELVQIG
jgi:hypothetical protein